MHSFAADCIEEFKRAIEQKKKEQTADCRMEKEYEKEIQNLVKEESKRAMEQKKKEQKRAKEEKKAKEQQEKVCIHPFSYSLVILT